MRRPIRFLSLGLIVMLLVSGCAQQTANAPAAAEHADAAPVLAAVSLEAGEKLRVVTTINIVADVVQRVGGDRMELSTLLPIGADPHSYAAAPADLRMLEAANVIFMVGNGLEEAMLPVLENHEGGGVLVAVNDGLELLEIAEDETHTEEEEHAEEDGHHHGGVDPHTWQSVPNVIRWVDNIQQTLQTLDPANAAEYQAAAEAYRAELTQLEAEIQREVATIPAEQRKLVTDHDDLGYFAAQYGFTVVGSVIPSFSTLAAPSAQELAALQTQIETEGIQAIFVGTTVSARLEEQLSNDTGVQLVKLYTDSLSEPDGPAATYQDLMRYNVEQIVAALR